MQNEFTSLVKRILDATYNALKEEAESFENIKIDKYIAENFDERARHKSGLPAVDINDNTAAFSIYDAYIRKDFNALTYYFASFYKL